MPDLAHYMAQYDHEHSSVWNKILHGIGIPLIFAGIVLLLFMKWIWGGSFFVGGWMLLFLGHKVEGNHPAFFQGPVYLLVGPIWVAKKIWDFLIGKRPRTEVDASKTEPR
jgi:uncharacterized membrane protein YGL010W